MRTFFIPLQAVVTLRSLPLAGFNPDRRASTPFNSASDAFRRRPDVALNDGTTLDPQAIEQRVVSQDLELWLTNANVEDGYNLLARAGRQVQEIHVVTELTRDAIKVAIKRATSALK